MIYNYLCHGSKNWLFYNTIKENSYKIRLFFDGDGINFQDFDERIKIGDERIKNFDEGKKGEGGKRGQFDCAH